MSDIVDFPTKADRARLAALDFMSKIKRGDPNSSFEEYARFMIWRANAIIHELMKVDLGEPFDRNDILKDVDVDLFFLCGLFEEAKLKFHTSTDDIG